MVRICCWLLFVVDVLPLSEFSSRAASSGYLLTDAFPGLTFINPVGFASPPGEANRLFIVEKKGRIVVITNLAAPTRTIFMDISGQVTSGLDSDVGGEEGLLGLAFHPGYATNGCFYVFYIGPASTPAGSGLHDILSRYKVSGSNPNQGDSSSEVRLIVQYDQAGNHNAGDLHFGPDGDLYVSLGDEGGANDTYGNSQHIDRDFFSAIMRIDVDKRPGSLTPNAHFSSLPSLTNYAIPPDNPYIGRTSFNGSSVNPNNVRTEFWAVGMRNPWRFNFDPVTGDLYLGHVGQDTTEWVNIVTNGANCGWVFYEGSRWLGATLPPGFVLTPPIVVYEHTSQRKCIIGGVVYRGGLIPSLYGAYLYADYVSGEIWALRYSGGTVTQNSVILKDSSPYFTSFGVDPSNGDVLIAAARSGTDSIIERIISEVPVQFPSITNVTVAGGSVVLQGTNGPANQTYYIVASSNVTQSVDTWPAVATGLFDSSGNFNVTNPLNPSLRQRFYRVQVP
jgi:glucose/arabinose dehydrogenase